MMYTVTLSAEQLEQLDRDAVPVKLSFVQGKKGGEVFAETHQVPFNQQGRGRVVIGQGERLFGSLEEVPWASGDIYLRSEYQLDANNPFELVRTEQLWSVPYAYYAREASELVLPDSLSLRSGTSAHWLTSGNTGNQSPYHVLGTMDDQDLVFKVNNEERMRLNSDGRLVVKAGNCCTTTDQSDKSKYPVLVSGSNQGIWIEIKDKRNTSHNFMTFQDKDKILGRIEGETISEWEDDEPYKNQIKLFAIEAASFVAQIAGEIANGSGELPFPCSAAGGAPNFAFAAQLGVDLVNYGLRIADWQTRGRTQNGVNFNSGGADYAEWLPLTDDTPDLESGQVVGIREGQATLHTDSTQIIRVVSSNPIVVGNVPPSGKTDRMERIAFLGQAPVLVAGPVERGDYVLPSGNHDGYAIAVAPAEMKMGDYPRIIGVAWESGDRRKVVQLINTGIGVQTDPINHQMAVIEAKWATIQQHVSADAPVGKPRLLSSGSQYTTLQPALTMDHFEAVLETYREPIEEVFSFAGKRLDERGVDLRGIGELDLFYNDPLAFLKRIRNDPAYASAWAIFDKYINQISHE